MRMIVTIFAGIWLASCGIQPTDNNPSFTKLAEDKSNLVIYYAPIPIPQQLSHLLPTIATTTYNMTLSYRLHHGKISQAVVYNADTRKYLELPETYARKIEITKPVVAVELVRTGVSTDELQRQCLEGAARHNKLVFDLNANCESLALQEYRSEESIASYVVIPSNLIKPFLEVVSNQPLADVEVVPVDLEIGSKMAQPHRLVLSEQLWENGLANTIGGVLDTGRAYPSTQFREDQGNYDQLTGMLDSVKTIVSSRFYLNGSTELTMDLSHAGAAKTDTPREQLPILPLYAFPRHD